jgi:hypothetical protein
VSSYAEIVHMSVRVHPRNGWVAFDEQVAIAWFARCVEVVEGCSGLARPSTFREVKASWGRKLGMESTPLPRAGKVFEGPLIDVVTPNGTLTFIVSLTDRFADVGVSVDGEAGGSRSDEIRLWVAEFFGELLAHFAPGDLSMYSTVSVSPDVGALVRCQAWHYDNAINEQLLAPQWALTLTREQRALVTGDVIDLTDPTADRVVVRAPFAASCRDAVLWEQWFTQLAPIIGPIDFAKAQKEGVLCPS